MSEKKPFDAAIKYLRQRLLGFPKRGLWSISDEYKQECLDMEAAIHFLEAAGKVNKAKLHLRCGSLIRLTPELDALLESLPEKEGK